MPSPIRPFLPDQTSSQVSHLQAGLDHDESEIAAIITFGELDRSTERQLRQLRIEMMDMREALPGMATEDLIMALKERGEISDEYRWLKKQIESARSTNYAIRQQRDDERRIKDVFNRIVTHALDDFDRQSPENPVKALQALNNLAGLLQPARAVARQNLAQQSHPVPNQASTSQQRVRHPDMDRLNQRLRGAARHVFEKALTQLENQTGYIDPLAANLTKALEVKNAMTSLLQLASNQQQQPASATPALTPELLRTRSGSRQRVSPDKALPRRYSLREVVAARSRQPSQTPPQTAMQQARPPKIKKD